MKHLLAALLCVALLCAQATSSPWLTPAFADEPAPGVGRLILTESSLWEVGAVGLGDTNKLDGLGISHRVIALISIPGEEDYREAFQISFDTSRVDINTCGIYPMPAILPEPYSDYENDLADFTVEVFDPAIPRIYSAGYAYAWGRGSSFYISYTYTGALEALRLWRSDDRGATWRTYWDGATEEQESENLVVELLGGGVLDVTFYNPDAELAGKVMLTFEVPALKTGSDILWLNLEAEDVTSGIGGDRDGGDRVRLPWQDSILGGGKAGGGSKGGSEDAGDANSSEDDSEDTGESGTTGGNNTTGGSGTTGGNNTTGGSGTGGNAKLILSPLPSPVQDTNDTTVAENAEEDAETPSANTASAGDAALANKPVPLLDTTTTSLNASDQTLPLVIFISLGVALLLIATVITFVRRLRRHDLRGS